VSKLGPGRIAAQHHLPDGFVGPHPVIVQHRDSQLYFLKRGWVALGVIIIIIVVVVVVVVVVVRHAGLKRFRQNLLEPVDREEGEG
jgi:hypothetical protein